LNAPHRKQAVTTILMNDDPGALAEPLNHFEIKSPVVFVHEPVATKTVVPAS